MSTSAMPAYTSLLVWGTFVFLFVAVVFILMGFKENRAQLVSEETAYAVVAALAAMGCAYIDILVEPLTAIWIGFVVALLAAWGAIVDHNRISKARRPAAGTKAKGRP